MTSTRRAKAILLSKAPFWGYFSTKIKIIRTRGKKAYTDGKAIYIGELGEKNIDVAAIIEHELIHIVFQHPNRGEGKDHTLWNLAVDAVANYIVQNDLEYLPSFFAVRPERTKIHIGPLVITTKRPIGEMKAEDIYEILKEHAEEIKKIVKTLPQWEEHRYIEVNPEEIQKTVREAAEFAKAIGKEPGNLEEIIRATSKRAQINWKRYLLWWIAQKTRDDYTWMRPAKHYWSTGVYLPGTSGKSGELFVILDTSASMSKEELEAVTGVIKYAWNKHRFARVVLIECDTEVTDVKVIRHPNQLNKLTVKGRGGTDMNPAIEEAKKRGAKAVVILTDGEIPPIEEEKIPILVVTTNTKPPERKNVRVVKVTV